MIVLARMVKREESSPTEFELKNRNWFPKVIQVWRPVAIIWCKKEKQGYRQKAEAFVKAHGYKLYDFPSSERNPLEKAKKLIIKEWDNAT